MVTHSRASLGTHGLRPLGLPQQADVEVNTHGIPVALLRGRRLASIVRIEERWRIAEGWWREDMLARTYVRARLDDGLVVTIFHDDGYPPADGWFEQRY